MRKSELIGLIATIFLGMIVGGCDARSTKSLKQADLEAAAEQARLKMVQEQNEKMIAEQKKKNNEQEKLIAAAMEKVPLRLHEMREYDMQAVTFYLNNKCILKFGEEYVLLDEDLYKVWLYHFKDANASTFDCLAIAKKMIELRTVERRRLEELDPLEKQLEGLGCKVSNSGVPTPVREVEKGK